MATQSGRRRKRDSQTAGRHLIGRGSFEILGVRRGRHGTGIFAELLAGDKVANHQFAVPFLRKQRVGEELAVAGETWFWMVFQLS